MICQFIDAHRARFGVVPICCALTAHGVQIAPRTYWASRSRLPSRRALWNTAITQVLAGSMSLTGGVAVRRRRWRAA